MKFRIKKKDKVVVISGREKGKVGEVLEVIPPTEKRPALVLISKVNMITRHRKPTQGDAGGRVQLEAPLALSKVMVVDPKTNKPTRTRIKTTSEGRVRVAVGSGELIS